MSAASLYGLVLFSAIAHAAWNALMKSADDRMLTMATLRFAGLVLGLSVLPFVDWPARQSLVWLALTAAAQFVYYVLLVRAYGVGDMSVVYPLARGLAPMLTTLVAAFAIGETLTASQVVAVGLISLGIMVLSLGAGARWQAVRLAIATGAVVATYSFFAGLGVRQAGAVLSFQACLEIVTGLGTVGYVAAVRFADLATFARKHAAAGLLAGALSVAGFLAYLIAARSLPLGPVVALRETSVIFGAMLGSLVLKEGFGLRRLAAACLVAAGIGLVAMPR
ncbi:MAG TPA: DMT family transporter [Reyranella sp.]|nr:DMT family transporter [Reyranella sp.]